MRLLNQFPGQFSGNSPVGQHIIRGDTGLPADAVFRLNNNVDTVKFADRVVEAVGAIPRRLF